MKKIYFAIAAFIMFAACADKENQARISRFEAEAKSDPGTNNMVSFRKTTASFDEGEARTNGFSVRKMSILQIKQIEALDKKWKKWEVVGVIKY